MNAPTIVTHPARAVDLSAIVIAYLEQHACTCTLAIIEGMAVELAQIERLTGDSDFSESELAYACKIASGSPIGFDDVPASLLPC